MHYSLLSTLLILSLLATVLIIPIQASAQTVTQGEWKTGYIRVVTSPLGAHDATIRYKLSSGEIGFIYYDANGKQIERDAIWADPYFQQLALNILSNSSGTLILELPRTVIDSKMPDNVTDAPLKAFFHQDTSIIPADIHELNKTADMRVVSIDFPVLRPDSAYNIGITGSYAMPEFGAIAPIALGLSLGSMLFLSIRLRRFSSDKQPKHWPKFMDGHQSISDRLSNQPISHQNFRLSSVAYSVVFL